MVTTLKIRDLQRAQRRAADDIGHTGGEAKCKNARLKADAAGRSSDSLSFYLAANAGSLCRLFQVGREPKNLPTLLQRDPLHLRFESGRNVKLNHLCHNHPPIHPSYRSITAKGVLLSCLVRCGRGGKVSRNVFARGRNFREGAVLRCAQLNFSRRVDRASASIR